MAAKRKADEAFVPSETSLNAQSRSRHVAREKSDAPPPGRTLNTQRSKLQDRAAALSRTRQQLPIWPHADEIRAKVRDNDVVLLVGETGSGKSTQIPQFLCSEKWCKASPGKGSSNVNGSQKGGKSNIGGRIAILQPRRVAAISLATRVAQEIGTPLGSCSPASTVGYSVRFDNNVSPSTKIKFLTDGMLLQELLRDPWLKEYSCVIVDEVHERGVNVDLVLGFLRRILDVQRSGNLDKNGRHGVPLKVIVMSATADMEGIQQFFSTDGESTLEAAPSGTKQGDGSRNPSLAQDEWSGFSDDDEPSDQEDDSAPKRTSTSISVEACYIKGRQYPVTMNYTPMPVTNILDTAMDRIMQIHQHAPLPGDVLVFLSGQEMIDNLESLCHTYATALAEQQKPQSGVTPNKQRHQQHQKLPFLQILPLFASLPTHLQARIFQPTPPFTRRIILSTNIAETSITVPGIRHVIDTGKHKSRLFRPGLNLDTLLSTPISQSMAKQRAGRAGREAAGTCYRLYTEKDYWDLEKDAKPEILQTDLAFLVLTLKAHNLDDVLGFPLLTRPPRRSLEAALEGLLNLEALDLDTGAITDVGRKMASLPVRPDLARILLQGSKYGREIQEGVVDIVSALSLEEGIFLPIHNNKRLQHEAKKSTTEELLLNREGKKRQSAEDASDDEEHSPVEAARRQLLSRHSDHLTLLNAIQAYEDPNTHDRKAWSDQHGISHRAMSRIMEVRKQLRQMVRSPRFQLADSWPTESDVDANANAPRMEGALGDLQRREAILKCLISGLWPNIAILTSLAPSQASKGQTGSQPQNPNQRAPYTTLLTNQGIHIHPGSVMFTQRSTPGRRKEEEESGRSGDRGGRQGAETSGMPRAIMFTDLIYTSKPYARNVSAVELSWVVEMGKLS